MAFDQRKCEEGIFHRWLGGLCVKTKRAFSRLISGLHESINEHYRARQSLQDTCLEKKWGHTLQNFTSGFDEILTEGENSREFVFSLLKRIRPLSKVLPFSGHPDFQLLTRNEV